MLSHSQLFVTPWTVAHQASLSMGFPRQEYWSGLSFPSPTDLPNLGIESASPAMAGGFLTTEPPGKPYTWLYMAFILELQLTLQILPTLPIEVSLVEMCAFSEHVPQSKLVTWRCVHCLSAVQTVLGFLALMEISKALRSLCAYIQTRMNFMNATFLH